VEYEKRIKVVLDESKKKDEKIRDLTN